MITLTNSLGTIDIKYYQFPIDTELVTDVSQHESLDGTIRVFKRNISFTTEKVSLIFNRVPRTHLAFFETCVGLALTITDGATTLYSGVVNGDIQIVDNRKIISGCQFIDVEVLLWLD